MRWWGPHCERNRQIVLDYRAGVPVTKLAQQHDMTHQRVYQIIAKGAVLVPKAPEGQQ